VYGVFWVKTFNVFHVLYLDNKGSPDNNKLLWYQLWLQQREFGTWLVWL